MVLDDQEVSTILGKSVTPNRRRQTAACPEADAAP
jgi:hypothetical protein